MGENVEKALRKALKAGKVYFGSKKTLKALKKGEVRLVVVAKNCPDSIRESIKSFNVPVIPFNGENMELGAVCGKPFGVAALAVLDAEDEILNAV